MIQRLSVLGVFLLTSACQKMATTSEAVGPIPSTSSSSPASTGSPLIASPTSSSSVDAGDGSVATMPKKCRPFGLAPRTCQLSDAQTRPIDGEGAAAWFKAKGIPAPKRLGDKTTANMVHCSEVMISGRAVLECDVVEKRFTARDGLAAYDPLFVSFHEIWTERGGQAIRVFGEVDQIEGLNDWDLDVGPSFAIDIELSGSDIVIRDKGACAETSGAIEKAKADAVAATSTNAELRRSMLNYIELERSFVTKMCGSLGRYVLADGHFKRAR